MKYILIFFVTVALGASCQKTVSGNEKLEKSILKVIKAFNDKDASSLHKMIHKDYGLTVVFRSGVFDEFKTIDKIDFSNPVPSSWPYPEVTSPSGLTYEATPVYDCGSETWDKKGLFCDTSSPDGLLLRTVHILKKYAEIDTDPAIVEKFKALESISRRVVLIDKDGKSLIFSLSLIKGKWYITALDRVSGDCSS